MDNYISNRAGHVVGFLFSTYSATIRKKIQYKFSFRRECCCLQKKNYLNELVTNLCRRTLTKFSFRFYTAVSIFRQKKLNQNSLKGLKLDQVISNRETWYNNLCVSGIISYRLKVHAKQVF